MAVEEQISPLPEATTPEVVQAVKQPLTINNTNQPQPITSCFRTSQTKQRCNVRFTQGTVCSGLTEDGHPDYRGPAMRVRTLRTYLPQGEPLNKRNILALEEELGAEYTPSIERLKRRAGLTPPIQRYLPFAGQPAAEQRNKRARARSPTSEERPEEDEDQQGDDDQQGNTPPEKHTLEGWHPYTGNSDSTKR